MATSGWQDNLPSLKERLKFTFRQSLFCDVEFLVDDGGKQVTVSANKTLLAISSSVFEAMFYGKLAETKSPIHLPDSTKEGLREIIRYAHYEEAKLTRTNVMNVLYLAKKYMMPLLREMCIKYIKNEIKPGDMLVVLLQLQTLGERALEDACWKSIDRNIDKALASPFFVYLPLEFLCRVIERSSLEVDREVHLFQAIDRWATKTLHEEGKPCNGNTKRLILGEQAIRRIRFSLMTQKEFAEVVLPSKLLTQDEVNEVIQVFNNVPPKSNFFVHQERAFTNRQIIVSQLRFNEVSPKLREHRGISLKESIARLTKVENSSMAFSVNKPTALIGLRLFGTKGAMHRVTLKVLANGQQCISEVNSWYTAEKRKSHDLYYGFTVKLAKRVTLTPEVIYIVQAEVRGSTTHMGFVPLNTVHAGDIRITFYTIPSASSVGWSVIHSQFPSLILR